MGAAGNDIDRTITLASWFLLVDSLFLDSWSLRAVAAALFLFIVARPLGVMFSLTATAIPMNQRVLLGWFGVRGIGSLYYLMYVIEYGVSEKVALELIHITLIVITLSILLHGISVRGIMARIDRPAETARSDQRG